MGLTHIKVNIANPAKPRQALELSFLVDSGDVLFRLNGRQGAAPVIFGEKQDSTLLGTISLEALGMMLDPMKRELRPLPMLLAWHNL